MSAMAQSTQPVSPCPAHHNTDLPTTGDETKSHMKHDDPAFLAERGLFDNISNTLEQILDVLRGSTIEEERGTDTESKFWATYKKVSNQYDKDLLKRADADMSITLIFAGLFSAVNSTFIIGMQPNPVETTNVLMVQLIKVIAEGSNAVDISNLPLSTTYPSSSVWKQTLAYASLSFSLLAASGAVMVKQWLNSYKAARRGSLEERGMQRQMKLDGLHWQLQTVLKMTLVLLQISLLLLGLSLSANMWTLQRTISSVIIFATTIGALFYGVTVFVFALRPDSPFQMTGVTAICQKFLPFLLRSTHHTFTKSSAIRWILETSMNPEVVEVAAAMVPLVQWPQRVDTSATYARLRDTFTTYRDRQELFAKCGKALAHLSIQSANDVINDLWCLWDDPDAFGGKSRLIRDAFIAGHDAWDKSVMVVKDHHFERQTLQADVRTALRAIFLYGRWSFSDHLHAIWFGDLQWHHDDGHTPQCKEFNWLIDYLVQKVDDGVDEETQGDALLALSAMHGLGSPAKRPLYVKALINCMGPTRPPRVRNAALRAVFDARREVASIANDSVQQGIDTKLLDELSCALLNTVRPNRDQVVRDNIYQDLCYVRLIFSLAQNDEWHQRLAHDGHIELCISLLVAVEPSGWASPLYIIAIFMRISGNLPSSFPQERWRNLICSAWTHTMITSYTDYFFETLPALVTATRQNFQGPSNDVASDELQDLTQCLRKVVGDLQRVWNQSLVATRRVRNIQGIEASEQATLANGQAHDLFDTVFRDVQGLHDDLSRMSEHPDTSQGDDRFVG